MILVPETIPSLLAPTWCSQVEERYQILISWCIELDRIRGVFERDMLRACADHDRHRRARLYDQSLPQTSAILARTAWAADLEAAFQVVHECFTRALEAQVALQHEAAVSLLAVQCLSWPHQLEHLVPALEAPLKRLNDTAAARLFPFALQ